MNPVRGIETTNKIMRNEDDPNFQINESRSRDWNSDRQLP